MVLLAATLTESFSLIFFVAASLALSSSSASCLLLLSFSSIFGSRPVMSGMMCGVYSGQAGSGCSKLFLLNVSSKSALFLFSFSDKRARGGVEGFSAQDG